MTNITISKKEYIELLYNTAILEELEGCGVDNWSGYDVCEFPSYEDIQKSVK